MVKLTTTIVDGRKTERRTEAIRRDVAILGQIVRKTLINPDDLTDAGYFSFEKAV